MFGDKKTKEDRLKGMGKHFKESKEEVKKNKDVRKKSVMKAINKAKK